MYSVCISYSHTVVATVVHAILASLIIVTQVNLKFCELKGGNIGIVEKAQETRFGMS